MFDYDITDVVITVLRIFYKITQLVQTPDFVVQTS
jgi:hypothetical protein